MTFEFRPAQAEDLDALVEVRIAAMRESLERIGRFDPARARQRFASGFSPAHTRWICLADAKAGFVVVKPQAEALLLDHLYILPAFQRKGLGSAVLTGLLDEAATAGRVVQVGALRGSEANRFYQRHGFVQVREEDWDIYYQAAPRPAPLQD